MSTIFGNFFTSKNDNSSQPKTQSTSSKSRSNSILGDAKSLAAATEKSISNMTSYEKQPTEQSAPMMSERDSSSSSSGLYSYLSFRNIIIFFVILLFLGYNILSAAGSTAEDIRYGLQPILSSIGNVFGLTIGSFIKTTSDESTKGVVTIAETTNKAIGDTIDGTERVLGGTTIEKDEESEEDEEDEEDEDEEDENNGKNEKALDKAIDLAPQKKSVVEADEAGSKTQAKSGKAGWCYIGEDRGFRSCAKVGRQQDCESGEYFSRKELCENPDLRQ